LVLVCHGADRFERLLVLLLRCASLRVILMMSLVSLAGIAGCSVNQIQAVVPIANLGGAFTAVAGTQQPFHGGASTDPANEPLTYTWNFGDGSTGTGVNPMHTYAMVGTATVTLTVTDSGGMSSTATAKGTISPGDPVANAGGPYAGTVVTPVNVSGGGSTDPQAENLTFAWNFGDGSTPGTGVNVSHLYLRPGTYTLSVVASNSSNLSATATAQVVIATTAPKADAGGPYSGTVATAVSVSGSKSTDPQAENLTFAWNFGDGSAPGAGVNTSHIYRQPGTYIVSLVVTNTSDLSATATAQAIIGAAAPNADAGGPYSGTVATAVSVSGSGSTDPQVESLGFAWNFGDGSSQGTGASTSHIYQRPGTYTLSVVATNTSNLSATATTQVMIAAAAPNTDVGGPYTSIAGNAVSFIGGKSSDPQGETLTYAWTFGDGSTGTGVSPSHIYGLAGTYAISLTVTNTSGLSGTASTKVTVAAAPNADAGGPYTAIAGNAVSFSGSKSSDPQDEVLTYMWTFGDGSTGTGVSPSHIYGLAGTYAILLTVTNTSGLSATASTTAAIAAPADGRVMAGLQAISNSSVQLYAVAMGSGAAAMPLLTTPVITDENGGFSIGGAYRCPSPGTQVYLTATGGNPGLVAGTNNARISLIAALGSCASVSSSLGDITIDEVSTTAAVWPGSSYLSSALSFAAADPRLLSNAFVDSANLANIARGTPIYPGIALAGQDLAMRSLANSLHSCVSSNGDTSAGSPCGLLFAAVAPGSGPVPTDTASAALAVAINPLSSVSSIYYLGMANAAFQPALQEPPTDWTLGLPRSAPANFSPALNRTTVFMGDSITAFWPLPDNNRGIGGQHASDMLARFSGDVLGHGYARVVILAGTNDFWYPIAGSDQLLQQIEAMAAMARAAGIEVVLCELTPMTQNPVYFNGLFIPFNAALADFAATNGYLLVDYFTPMVGHPEYFIDGVHPNTTGYAVMEAALSSVVEQ
jgi:PKD repeat protein/lysophospholipase L1-like esterase